MSLQSTSSIWKWNFTTTIRRGSCLAAVFALFLVVALGHSQTTASQITATRTALSVAAEGAKTTLTVTVKDATGAVVSDGTVSFVSNGLSLGSAIVQADGTATLTLDKVPAATRQITAVYSGTERYAASSSASAQLQANVTSGPPDFTVAANPTTIESQPRRLRDGHYYGDARERLYAVSNARRIWSADHDYQLALYAEYRDSDFNRSRHQHHADSNHRARPRLHGN